MAGVVSFIESRKKGGRYLNLNNYLFIFNKEANNARYYKCKHHGCKNKVCLEILTNEVKSKKGEHNHPNDQAEIQALSGLQILKKRVLDEPTAPILQIYREEASKLSQSLDILAHWPSFYQIKSVLYSLRSSVRPTLPKTIIHEVHLNGEWRETIDDESLLLSDEKFGSHRILKKAEKDNREIDESLFEPEITIKEEVLDEPPQVTITGSAGATSWSDETASNRPLMMPDVMCTACPTISTMTYTMCPALPAQSSLSQLSSLVTRTNPHASYSEYPVYSNSPSTSSTFHNQPHVMNVQMPVITQVVGSAETITSLPEKRDDSSGDRPRDQFDAYGEYIASKLRQLDWKSCACVQKAIGDLLFEAEMGKFKN